MSDHEPEQEVSAHIKLAKVDDVRGQDNYRDRDQRECYRNMG